VYLAAAPSPYFLQVFIPKELKVICFDTDLEVLILKGLAMCRFWAIRQPPREKKRPTSGREDFRHKFNQLEL
jgi:hypothetical protein